MMQWILLATEAAQAPPGGLFDINATLPLMAVQILVLAAILNALFFKPIGNVLDERDGYIRDSRREAKDRLDKAKTLTQEYEQALSASRKQAQSIVADAQTEADRIAAQQLAEAVREAQAQREAAQRDIDQQKAAALQTIEQQAEGLSQQILDKLLQPQG